MIDREKILKMEIKLEELKVELLVEKDIMNDMIFSDNIERMFSEDRIENVEILIERLMLRIIDEKNNK